MCALIANPNTKPRTIIVTNFYGIQDEAIASGIFSPGNILKLDNAGKVLKNSVEGSDDILRVATEPVLAGAGSTGFIGGGTVDTAYAVGDNAYYRIPQRGEKFQAILKAGVAYAIGDTLINDGSGRLKKASAATTTTLVKRIVAVVETALDLSATAAVDTLGVVRAN